MSISRTAARKTVARKPAVTPVRAGVTLDGKAKLKSPSGSLSVAEAISVLNNGLALAAHFGPAVAANAGAAIASILIYVLMAAVLFYKPQGLFPAHG